MTLVLLQGTAATQEEWKEEERAFLRLATIPILFN